MQTQYLLLLLRDYLVNSIIRLLWIMVVLIKSKEVLQYIEGTCNSNSNSNSNSNYNYNMQYHTILTNDSTFIFASRYVL